MSNLYKILIILEFKINNQVVGTYKIDDFFEFDTLLEFTERRKMNNDNAEQFLQNIISNISKDLLIDKKIIRYSYVMYKEKIVKNLFKKQ